MKTIEKIDIVLKRIEFDFASPFTFSEVKPAIANMEYAFTCLRHAGVLKSLSAGRYELVKDHGLTPEQIHERALKVMENNRKETKLEGEMKLPLETEFIKEEPINIPYVSGSYGLLLNSNDTFRLTEEKAIAFLKDLGYKILKPVK